MAIKEKIPVYLLTGFLGSGKTTFLNRILKLDAFKDSLVIVNEFGSVPVDHLLVEESAETIYELSNGCLCCNMRGELVETLASLELEKFSRIFIETTGIADPLPIFQTVAFNPDMAMKLTPQSILSVFDLTRGASLLLEHEEARKQLAVADHVLFTKDDLNAMDEALLENLQTYNSNANYTLASDIHSLEQIASALTEKTGTANASHSGAYKSTILRTNTILDFNDLVGMMQMIINQLGSHLLRIKGFATVAEHDQPLVVQVSGQIFHEPVPHAGSIEGQEKTQLVMITKDIDPQIGKSIFDGFAGTLTTDTADRETLQKNPLSIPGM